MGRGLETILQAQQEARMDHRQKVDVERRLEANTSARLEANLAPCLQEDLEAGSNIGVVPHTRPPWRRGA